MIGTRSSEAHPHPAHGAKEFGDWLQRMQSPPPGKIGFAKRAKRRSRMVENRKRLPAVIAKRAERRQRDMDFRNGHRK